MIASLGMYDRAETASANDALWAGIRQGLGFGPHDLDRTSDFWDIWQSPELLFSQTCGMPYRIKLHESVQLVGTPNYNLPDVAPGYYYSVMVVRSGDSNDFGEYPERKLAYNGPDSQSGWAAPQNYAAELGFRFENLFCSGGHLASATAVANGDADIAALDAVTWDLINAYEGVAKDLKVVQKTTPTPGLPYITSRAQDAGAIYAATQDSIDGLHVDQRHLLRLKGIVSIDAATYLEVPTPAAP